MDHKAIGRTIRFLRNEKGWAQWELGEKSGVGQSFISDMELGNKPGFEDTRREVSAALGWSYEMVLDLTERVEKGEDPKAAKAKVQMVHDLATPPPFFALDTKDLRGVRIHDEAGPTGASVWVHQREIGERKPSNLKAYLIGTVLVFVDHGSRAKKINKTSLFLLRMEPASRFVLRQAKQFPGSLLLTGLEGETEATAKPWAEICQGRVLWYQVNLELAEAQEV